MSKPVVSSRTPTGLIINGDGTATFAFLKWMQNIGSTVNVAFDSEGAYQGDIGDQATIVGRETLASIVQNISTDGVVQGPGIDFALPYLNKDTDHIADGTGSPLAGGKVAYAALVASAPAAGQTIRFNGTSWLPVAIAVSKTAIVSQWLRSYDAATGSFTASQPAFSDVSGVATKAQLPPAIAYEDEANTFTANQTINGVLAVTGNATVGGNLGVTGNISAANFPGPSSMVYPAAGIGVSTGTAWAASIDPATVPRTNVSNTFTANQTVTGKLTATSIQVGQGISIDEYPDGATARYLNVNTTSPATIGALTFGSYSSDFSHVLTYINCQPTSMTFMGGTASISLAGAGHFTSVQAGNTLQMRSDNTNSFVDATGGTLNFNVNVGGTPAIVINGTLFANGAKNFRIPHPLDDAKFLVHSCLEGPEVGVFYRGEAETVEGLVQVVLPDYFEALTFAEDRSVQLTQIEDGVADFAMLRASRISDGKFSIRSSAASVKVAWEVKAVRRVGVERLQVAPDKA